MQWPGEKLLEKLWYSIADKGIGSLLKPWQMRREGTVSIELKRLALLTEAQAEVEAESIRTGRQVLLANGKISEAPSAANFALHPSQNVLLLQEALAIASHNVDIEALRREISISKAVVYAEAELAQETKEPSSLPLSDDWLLRWRENAAAVSSDELQSLWGKVLAGEVKSPGQFSLRVLDFLRNLSQTEAKDLELISQVTTGNFLLRCDEALIALGITPILLKSAEELGIIIGTGAIGLNWQAKSDAAGNYESVIPSGKRAIWVRGVDPAKCVSMPCYELTHLGRQVLHLAGGRIRDNYLITLGAEIKKQGFDVFICDYALVNGNMHQMTNGVLL